MQANILSNISHLTQIQANNTTKNTQEKTKNQNTNSNNNTFEKLNTLGAKHITNIYLAYFEQETLDILINTSNIQTGINNLLNGTNLDITKSILSKIDLASLDYNSKNPLYMDTNELEQILSKDGFFGVENTANRIADFIIKGSGDNIEKLKQGLEGMKQGFKQAEKMWGGKLPQISQDTIDAAFKKVNERIDALNKKVLDIQA